MKFFVFFLVLVAVSLSCFAKASSAEISEEECLKAFGNSLCDSEKLKEEELTMPRGPMKAPARKKINMLDVAGKRSAIFPPR